MSLKCPQRKVRWGHSLTQVRNIGLVPTLMASAGASLPLATEIQM